MRSNALAAAARWVLLGHGSTGQSSLGIAGVGFS